MRDGMAEAWAGHAGEGALFPSLFDGGRRAESATAKSEVRSLMGLDGASAAASLSRDSIGDVTVSKVHVSY